MSAERNCGEYRPKSFVMPGTWPSRVPVPVRVQHADVVRCACTARTGSARPAGPPRSPRRPPSWPATIGAMKWLQAGSRRAAGVRGGGSELQAEPRVPGPVVRVAHRYAVGPQAPREGEHVLVALGLGQLPPGRAAAVVPAQAGHLRAGADDEQARPHGGRCQGGDGAPGAAGCGSAPDLRRFIVGLQRSLVCLPRAGLPGAGLPGRTRSAAFRGSGRRGPCPRRPRHGVCALYRWRVCGRWRQRPQRFWSLVLSPTNAGGRRARRAPASGRRVMRM